MHLQVPVPSGDESPLTEDIHALSLDTEWLRQEPMAVGAHEQMVPFMSFGQGFSQVKKPSEGGGGAFSQETESYLLMTLELVAAVLQPQEELAKDKTKLLPASTSSHWPYF